MKLTFLANEIKEDIALILLKDCINISVIFQKRFLQIEADI